MSDELYILVIDDNPSALRMMSHFITSLGYACKIAPSGEVALEIMRTDPSKVGLVFLDLAMPRMSGQEVYHVMHNDSDLADIPVVALTAITDLKVLEEITEAGVVDIVMKPFKRGELERALNEHFRTPSS